MDMGKDTPSMFYDKIKSQEHEFAGDIKKILQNTSRLHFHSLNMDRRLPKMSIMILTFDLNLYYFYR